MRLIRYFYPAAKNRSDVIAATFNDNNEGLTDADVYCFWVAPDEVAITLNEKHPKRKNPFGPTDNDKFPTDERLKAVPHRHLRLSPSGDIFFRARSITLAQAFALIDEIARFPKLDDRRVTAETYRSLSITLPPPEAGVQEMYTGSDTKLTPKAILDALRDYGAAKTIEVGLTW
jgi:hypothetical protein